MKPAFWSITMALLLALPVTAAEPTVVFEDGFEGKLIEGKSICSMDKVQGYMAAWGVDPNRLVYHKGWFEDTMPTFQESVDVALLDVDLLSSTRTCTRQLFPLIEADGVMFSQDGHLRATVDLFSSREFWRKEVGVPVPDIRGLGVEKLLELSPSERSFEIL